MLSYYNLVWGTYRILPAVELWVVALCQLIGFLSHLRLYMLIFERCLVLEIVRGVKVKLRWKATPVNEVFLSHFHRVVADCLLFWIVFIDDVLFRVSYDGNLVLLLPLLNTLLRWFIVLLALISYLRHEPLAVVLLHWKSCSSDVLVRTEVCSLLVIK